MAAIIEVGPEDSLATIRAKLLAASEPAALLVIERGTPALRLGPGAKVLARLSRETRLRVAVVTQDASVRDAMAAAGFSVFASVAAAQQARRWRTPQPLGGRALRRRHQRPSQGSQAALVPQLLALLFVIAFTGILGLGAAMLLPEANVVLDPASTRVEAAVTAAVVPGLGGVDYGSAAIPGRRVVVTVHGSWSQPVFSRQDVPDKRASGVVLLVNRRATPVTVPAGTVVRTGSGQAVRYRTLKEVSLPGVAGATVAVQVEAIDPGPQGNVGPYLVNTIDGPLAAQLSVVNEQPIEGGTVRQAGVVTQADRERVRAALLQRLDAEAHAAVQEQLGPGEFPIRESLVRERILNEGYDKLLGELADQLTVTLSVEYSELVFSGEDVSKIALAGLQGVVPGGYQLTPQGLETDIIGAEPGQAGWLVHALARGIARAQIDPGDVRRAIAGLPAEAAAGILQERFPLASPPVVEIWPAWLSTLPQVGIRIHVEVR